MTKIHSDIVAFRKLVGGLQAKVVEKGPRFAVKSAKDLMLKLREAGDELNMPICGGVVDQKFTHYPFIEGTDFKGNPKTVTMIHVVTTVRFMSDDGSYLDFVGSGHGSDDQDKAGGKASTYSWKDAVIKGLSIPDAPMDDTDDSGEVMTMNPRPSKAAPLIDRMNRSSSMEELKSVKAEVNKGNWGPQERSMLTESYIKNVGRFANAEE